MEYQTQQWLEEALFDLLATKKSLQNISIAELSEHAQIARRTFYRYYHSKEEVLTNYLDRLIQDYIIELQTEKLTNFEDFSEPFLSVLEPVHCAIKNFARRKLTRAYLEKVL